MWLKRDKQIRRKPNYEIGDRVRVADSVFPGMIVELLPIEDKMLAIIDLDNGGTISDFTDNLKKQVYPRYWERDGT